jgi:hypothetical protein
MREAGLDMEADADALATLLVAISGSPLQAGYGLPGRSGRPPTTRRWWGG